MKIIELPEIAKKVGVEPAVARARLRQLYKESNTHLPIPIKHWIFRYKDGARVEGLIK